MSGRARQPRLRDVLLEQVRVLWISLRIAALVGVALAGLASLVALPTLTRGGPLNINGWPTWLPGIMGSLLPIAVWGKDERFGPGFLWTLPVDRRRHALTKVLAGWLWLMAGVAVFLSWLFVMASVSGETCGKSEAFIGENAGGSGCGAKGRRRRARPRCNRA